MASATVVREQATLAHVGQQSFLEKTASRTSLASATTRPTLSSVSRVNSFRLNVSYSATNAAASLSLPTTPRPGSPAGRRRMSSTSGVRVELRNLVNSSSPNGGITQNIRASRFGEPTFFSSLSCYARRGLSFILSFSFLGSLMTAAIFTYALQNLKHLLVRATGGPPARRPFATIERQRAAQRTKKDHKVVRDIGYYAGLIGLKVSQFEVTTDDGFILQLYRVTDPTLSQDQLKQRYPVLLIHGLLQSAGAFCVNEQDSLAFYLCKSGYDVWLGNNRCGFNHKHVKYSYNDPRMWDWDVREMGTKDLPAFVNYIESQTGYEKIALACHSQGTAQTFLALSRYHIPELGNKISVFCALSPAVYAGPLVDRSFFKFMRYLPNSIYHAFLGIHAFIPAMIDLRLLLPTRALTFCSYVMFHFLFDWSDERWEKALEGRMFQFSPVYISAESMRWWLGKDGFATRRCIFPRDDPAEKWFDGRCPPVALWVAGRDSLVDGQRLIERLENAEPDVVVVKTEMINEYEHLDVLWAVDAVDHVHRGVKETIWETAWKRENCVVPDGCVEL
ncbi:lipase [Myxozyma melibiosi]|uniref:Lipase n=1 Tax=Myxozyma melibiosi TaxID=54550 RepID=A0ABR1EZV6_9ASCO